jgi:hypothetical protein
LIAFHLQTAGQTERQNQAMEQFLPAFSNNKQDDWAELPPLAKFAYNNSVHALTRMTLFWAMYHRHTEMQFNAPKASHVKSEIETHAMLEGLAETPPARCENILEAQLRQTQYTGGKDIKFDIGDKVGLSTKHFQTTRSSMKLDYKQVGPYTVSKGINRNAYKFDLTKQWGTTTFSPCHNSIDTHCQSQASH